MLFFMFSGLGTLKNTLQFDSSSIRLPTQLLSANLSSFYGKINFFSVSSVRIFTEDKHNYNQLSKSIINQDSLVFRVQACRDAHVALSEIFNNVQTRTYEIIIGGNGNTNSFLRDFATGQEKIKIDTPNIMDCNNYKAFWVKWAADGRITVGEGAVVGQRTFLDWVDPEQRVFRGMTISTWNGATGLWDFSFLDGIPLSILFLLRGNHRICFKTNSSLFYRIIF